MLNIIFTCQFYDNFCFFSGFNECYKLQLISSLRGSSKLTPEFEIYTRKEYLINARPVYQIKEGGDSLYFNNGVWQVINQVQDIYFSNLNVIYKLSQQNLICDIFISFQIGSLTRPYQTMIRNTQCRDVWSPTHIKCENKWEYWDGRHWKNDLSITILLKDCEGITCDFFFKKRWITI